MAQPGKRISQVFPPGDFLREELAARGWSQTTLAHVLGRPLQAVNGIVNGKKTITPQTAAELALAFGTSAEYWLNLQTAYGLARVKAIDMEIKQRAQQASGPQTRQRGKGKLRPQA
jgi:HTH-type transcriptional regulator / antitoxin HigA